MVVIHISGTTGSGKSWVGQLLSRIYSDKRLHHVDLDQIFRHALTESKTNGEIESRFRFIRDLVQREISRLRARYPNLLLTGYSDVMIGGDVRYIELNSDVKYFIDIPTKKLIEQYRSRAGDYVARTRHEVHSYSNSNLRKMVRVDLETYKKFRVMSQMDIVKDIILRLGK